MMRMILIILINAWFPPATTAGPSDAATYSQVSSG